jgi:lysophospholipase L1-like esterase
MTTRSRPAGKQSSLWVRIGVLLLGLIFSALLLEAAVLLLFGEQPKFPRRVVGAPWGLRYNEPGADYRHKSADGSFRFRINAQGMRADRDYAYMKPAGVKRIVSLGDSFTVGYEVQVEECFSSVLERELKEFGYNVEVLNAGVSGFSNAEEVLYFERELIKYDPDLVLLSFFVNDLTDNVRTGLFVLQDGKLAVGRKTYVPAGRLGNFLNSNPLFNFFSGYSNAFVFVKERATHILKRRMVEQNRANVSEADAAKPAQQNEAAQSRTDQQRRLAAAILDRLYEFAHGRGIPVVIQIIPSGGFTSAYAELPLTSVFPDEYFDADRPDLVLLPLIDVLRPHVGKMQIVNLRSHFHLTPAAHRLSGERLAELIHENGLLE